MAGTWRAPARRCQNVSVPDGSCAELRLRTRRPHIASVSQTSINPTFPVFRTFRTPHIRTRSSFLNSDYFYMKIMMKKNTTRNEGLKGAFVAAHMCGVRNVRNYANPHKSLVSSLFYVCGGRVRRHSSAHDTAIPPHACQISGLGKKSRFFFLHDCPLSAIHRHARRCERRARFHRADPVGWNSFISSRSSRPLFQKRRKGR